MLRVRWIQISLYYMIIEEGGLSPYPREKASKARELQLPNKANTKPELKWMEFENSEPNQTEQFVKTNQIFECPYQWLDGRTW